MWPTRSRSGPRDDPTWPGGLASVHNPEVSCGRGAAAGDRRPGGPPAAYSLRCRRASNARTIDWRWLRAKG